MSYTERRHIDFIEEIDFASILTNPILDIAARCWEPERYAAFQVFYRSMRVIDDVVDDRREGGRELSPDEQAQFERMIRDWFDSLRRGNRDDSFQARLLDTIQIFRMPLWPWERLTRAMIFDLSHNGFASFAQFLRYCEGASIAPAAVFMHMCGVQKGECGYQPPVYDIRRAARPLALFSYLVHILRDIQKDQLAGLNYFADDILARHGLVPGDLRAVAEGASAGPDFRRLIRTYVDIAEYYRLRARKVMLALMPRLEYRYRLSWELIHQLYLQIYQRVDPENGEFTTAALNPPPEDVQERINQTIAAFQRA